MCGREVSWPLEPSRYDLLVSSDQGLRRVQVKTTITRSGRSWQVFLSTARGERRTYDPHEIDDFFIIDGELGYYLIPVAVVGGTVTRHGQAVGLFIPVGPNRQAAAEAYAAAAKKANELLVEMGLDEDEIVSDFDARRKAKRTAGPAS